MADDLEYRIGASPRITHTVQAGSTPTAVTAKLYDADGLEVASITGSASAGDAEDLFDVSFVLPTSGRDAGDYVYTLSYTVGSVTEVLRGELSLLPVVSKFDRWVRRICDWMLETSKGEERQLSWRQFREATREAVWEYSKVCPHLRTEDVTLTEDVWAYDLPDEWVVGASQIEAVEYPVDDTEQVREWLSRGEWLVDEARNEWRFTSWEPDLGDAARLYYRTPHAVRDAAGTTAAADTVPDRDFGAVAQYAAGLCLDILANEAPRRNDPQAGAAIVGARTKSQEYSSRARAMREEAMERWQASASAGGDGRAPDDAPEETATWEYLPGHGI